MYKKYSKINDLAYIKRKVKLAKYHLNDRNYSEFFEINYKTRSDLLIQYEVSSLDLIQKLNKDTNKKRHYTKYFRCTKCMKLKNKIESYGNKGSVCKPCHINWRKNHYYGGYRQRAIQLDKIYAPKYKKKRMKKDPVYKLTCAIRSRTCALLRQYNWKKNKQFKDYIGCSPKELGEHIESQFEDGMNWKNHGTYWQLDHIIAIGLNSKTPEDVYTLNHYSNLQPLTIKEHKKKTKKDLKRK